MTSVASTSAPTVRAYAHCTAAGSGYTAGSVVVYAMNLDNATAKLQLDVKPTSQRLQQYVFTAPQQKLTSDNIELNGHIVRMTSDEQLPVFEPVTSHVKDGVHMPPYSIAFYVLPDASAKACISKRSA